MIIQFWDPFYDFYDFSVHPSFLSFRLYSSIKFCFVMSARKIQWKLEKLNLLFLKISLTGQILEVSVCLF